MATRTGTGLRRSNTDPSDDSYAIAAGLYTAVVLAPVVVLGLAGVTSNAAVLYLGFLGAVAGIATVAGWGVSRSHGLAVRLGGTTAVWLLAVVPFAWVIGVFGAATIGRKPSTIAALLAVIGTGGGAVLGFILVGMSRTRHTAAVLAEAEEFAQWEARWPQRRRRLAAGGMAIAGVAGVGGLAARFVFGIEWAGYLYYLIFLWTPFAGVGNGRTFRVTTDGLVVERPLQQRLKPWSAFTGYTLTDDALVVHPAAWWRPASRSDRADIEDVDSVVAPLDRILPEHE